MSYPGRNNAKISNQPSGGGNKLQGLAPQATHFFKALSTGRQYSTQTYGGLGRFKIVCMNQLGGVGSRYNSQFAPTADGTNCIIDESNIMIITQWLQNNGLNPSIFLLVLAGLNENYNTDLINSDEWATAYIVKDVITQLPSGGTSANIYNNVTDTYTTYSIPPNVQDAIKILMLVFLNMFK